jgi:hypothetical protein
MINKNKILNKENKPNSDCNLCQGTGVAEYFDMLDAPKVGEGTFTLGELVKQFGGVDKCPNCFPFQELDLNSNQL